jgi:hypothetical protein
MSAISRYRYQGDDVVTAQTSWAFTPRWILQGFVGGTRHASGTVRGGMGAGFRYLIARQYGLRTGIDVAFSEHEQAVYFNVGSGL